MQTISRNLHAITAYRIFSRMYFYLPIIFPFFYISGHSPASIELLLALYGISVTLFIKLSKKITFHIGHKHALVLGEFFKILGLFMFVVGSQHLSILIIAQIVMGAGYSLIVGNDTVILQQTLVNYPISEYQSIQAKTNSYMFIALLFSGLIGAFLFKYSPIVVMWLSIIAAILSVISVMFMIYQPIAKNSDSASASKVMYSSARYYYIVRSLVLAVFVGVLPYFFFVLTKTSMIWFGVILSLFTLCGFLSSKYLINLLKKYSLASIAMGSIFIISLSFLLLLFNNIYIGAITSIILGLISGCVRPLAIAKIDSKKYSVEKTLNRAERYYGIMNALILISAAIFFKYFNFMSYIEFLVTMGIVMGIVNYLKDKKENINENLF